MYQLQFIKPIRIGFTMSLSMRYNLFSRAFISKACDGHTLPKSTMYQQQKQMIYTSQSTNKFFTSELIPKINIFTKTSEIIRINFINRAAYKRKCYLLYRVMCDNFDYINFIKDFKMPDTFFSWFLITELHVWMLMVRLSTKGGRVEDIIRKDIVGAMWQDVDARQKQIVTAKSSTVRSQIQSMGFQFNAALIGYDEGLLSTDQVLAGAVWRRLFQSECNNPEFVEKIVLYIRKNIQILDSIPINVLIETSKVPLVDYKKLSI